MTTLAFERMQRRANAAVLDRLSNVNVVINHTPETGIFDNGSMDALNGAMIATDPTLRVPTVACERVREGDPVRIVDGLFAGQAFTVREPRPDGSGMTVLILQRVVRS